MFLNNWLRGLRSLLEPLAAQQGRKRRRHDRLVCRPRLEALEDRLTPATDIVNSTGDAASQDGVSPDTGNLVNGQPEVTLRSAIQAANAAGVSSSISFDIPTTDPAYNSATGQFLIQPQSSLPSIEAPVVINGYSQPGASPNTLAEGDNAVLPIVLDGIQQPQFSQALELDAGNSTVCGLAMQNFDYFSLWLAGPNNMIQGNSITETAGSVFEVGSGLLGVVFADAPNSLLGGVLPADRNVISGANDANVAILAESPPGTPGVTVEGNYIGTNAAGTAAATVPGEGGDGIQIGDDNNTIGGTVPGAGNVISGNTGGAVFFEDTLYGNNIGAPITGNVIEGNFIGTDASGTNPIPNGVGILFGGVSSEDSPIGTVASNAVIGGSTPVPATPSPSTTDLGSGLRATRPTRTHRSTAPACGSKAIPSTTTPTLGSTSAAP